jgi:hypothetical protein
MKGLSTSDLEDMRSFAQECPDRRIGQQSADQWPRLHIVTLVTELSDPVLRDGYAREAPDVIGQRSTAQLPWFHIETGLAGIEKIEAELSRDLGPEDHQP